MSRLMELISQQSWRDILLTALLATSILYYFVFKNTSHDVSSNNETQIASSEEERRRRRDHLAKIAEERAKKRSVAADATTITTTAAAAVASSETKGKSVSNKQYGASTETKLPTEAVTKTAASNRIEKKTSVQKNKTKDAISGASKTASNEAATSKKANVSNQEGVKNNEPPKNKENDSKVKRGDADKSKEVKDSSIQQIIGDSNPSEKADSDNIPNDAVVSNNEKEAGATLAAKTSDTKEVAQEKDQESITIYLIKSASPRIEITIPTNATSSQLRHVAANAADIPLTGLRLIFRGRMIVEKSTGSVMKEFGIEDGSALHVVGKPISTSAPSSSCSTASPSSQQQQTAPPSLQDMLRLIQEGLRSTPNFFHHAAATGEYDLIRAAIRVGIFNSLLNQADENDWTPLHEAIRGGHQHVVTLLLDSGGLDMHAITNQGRGYSPLSLSINYHGDHHPLTRMLRDRGGEEFWPDEDDESESSSSDESNEGDEDAEENPWRNR